MTVLIAVGGIFLLMTVWVGIDQLARRQLGERQRGCQAAAPDSGHHCTCGLNPPKGREQEKADSKPEVCPR